MENSQHSLTRVRFARTRYTLHYIPARLFSPLLSPPPPPLENSFNSVEESLNEARKCAVASIADQTKCSNRLLLPPIADELSPSRDLIRRMKKTSPRKRRKKKSRRNGTRFVSTLHVAVVVVVVILGGLRALKHSDRSPFLSLPLSLPITKLFVDCFLFISARG